MELYSQTIIYSIFLNNQADYGPTASAYAIKMSVYDKNVASSLNLDWASVLNYNINHRALSSLQLQNIAAELS